MTSYQPSVSRYDAMTYRRCGRSGLLAAPEQTWSEPFVLEFDWVPLEQRTVSRRKIALHALFHSQRHWAQLATLVRSAGFPSKFRGDLLFSPALR